MNMNPNTADKEALTQLPGVGPKLAEKLINARPFDTLDDLLRVPGVSENLLEKIKPNLEIPARLESVDAEPVEDAFSPEEPVSTQKEIILLEEKQPPVAGVSRQQVIWIALVAGLFSTVVSLVVVFSVFLALNDSLRYASPESINELQTQVELLQSQAGTLDSDVSALRTRVDNLDALGGRVTALETSIGGVVTEVNALAEVSDSLMARTDELTAEVDELATASSKYQDFINALQELLSNFAESETSNE
jgi:methyl-accepting chemotaxis protein